MKLSTEPTIPSLVTAAIIAIINVAALVGNWSGDLVAAINGAVGAVVVAIAAIYTRSKVVPLAKLPLQPSPDE